MALKIKAGVVDQIKQEMNIQEIAPNPKKHVWCDPVTTLFGQWKNNPDLLDFFMDVSHKKGLKQKPLKLDQVLKLIAESYDGETNTIDSNMWKKLVGSSAPVEGSAATAEEMTDMTYKVKEHYALVAVPTGFDWAARGINMKPLLQDIEAWETAVPETIREVWDVAVLIIIWIVYEALGLGGLNEEALLFHRLVRDFCRKGCIDEGKISIEKWKDEWNYSKSDYAFLGWGWSKLLKGNDIPDQWAENPQVFEVVIFLAHCREIVTKINKGLPWGDYLQAYTAWDLEVEEVRALAAACQILRDGAKGRLMLQDIIDKTQDTQGVLEYLTEKDPYYLLDLLAEMPGTEISLGGVALLDQVDLMKKWVIGRQEAKLAKADSMI